MRRRFRLVVSSVLVMLCVGVRGTHAGSNPRRVPNSREVAFSQRPLLSFAEVENLIARGAVASADDLLAILPADYRDYYTLVYRSHSLQPATPEFPRIVFYGPDARLVLTFSGDPDNRAYHTVEAMEYNQDLQRFALHEIRFDPDGRAPATVEHEPAVCNSCHGTPTQPLWDAYPAWRGVYGSRSANTFDRITKGSAEDTFYQRFQATQRHRGRYAGLKETVNEDLVRRIAERGSVLTFVTNGATLDPAAFLSEQLGELALRVAASTVKSDPNYESFREVLAFVALCSETLPETNTTILDGEEITERNPDYILPGNYLPEPLASGLTVFNAGYLPFVNKEFSARFREISYYNPPAPDVDAHGFAYDEAFTESLASLRPALKATFAFVYRFLGFDVRRWTMSPSRATYELEEGGPPALPRLAYLLLHEDPDFAPFCQPTGRNEAPHATCVNSLAPRSKAAAERLGLEPPNLQEMFVPKPDVFSEVNDTPTGAPAAVSECLQCHASRGRRAPLIPFDKPAELAILLRDKNQSPSLLEKIKARLADGSMPPTRVLTEGEKAELVGYLMDTLDCNSEPIALRRRGNGGDDDACIGP